MGIFDALNVSEKAMSVHRFRSEVAAENIANVHTPGYRRQEVQLQAGAFSTALSGARAGGPDGFGSFALRAGGMDSARGAVEISAVKRVAKGEFDERQHALKGVTDMMRSKSAFELNMRAATMLKSMALSSLEIGRGS